jgi:hypothetical protein
MLSTGLRTQVGFVPISKYAILFRYYNRVSFSSVRVWTPKVNTDRIKSSNQLKFEMETLFFNTQTTIPKIDAFILNNLKVCDNVSIADLLHMSVKQSKLKDVPVLLSHLPAIALR